MARTWVFTVKKMKHQAPQNWKHTLSNSQQLGGIETSVLDNGAGRGVRIAWINTGTGLRYKVVLDRGMDILDAFSMNIAWHGFLIRA